MEQQVATSQPTLARRLALLACYTLLLFVSFQFNVFNVAGHLRRTYIGYDSYLVLNRLHLAQHGGGALAPLVVKVEPSDPANPQNSQFNYVHYVSQAGLQGILLSATLQFTRLDPIFTAHVAAAAFCLATAAVLALFFVSIACRFGMVTAHLATFATALSPILAELSTSLYWATALMFAPFVCTWLLYPRCAATTRGRLSLAGLILLLVGLKAACGYEYMTSVTLGPVAAMAFHHALAGDFRLRHVWNAMLLFGAGCAGFLVAVSFHIWILSLIQINGIAVVFGRAQTRALLGNPQDEVYVDFHGRLSFLPDAVEYPVNCFIRYLEIPCIETPIGAMRVPFWAPVAFCFGLLAIAVLRRRTVSPQFRALAVGCGAAMLASLSWQMLVINHMCVHFHLNQIVYWVPGVLLATVAMGWLVQQAAARCKLERPLETLLVPACLGLMALNVQWSLMKDIARDTRQFRDQQMVTSALARLPDPSVSDGIVGYVDTMYEQPRATTWTREMAGSSLITMASKGQRELVITGWASDLDRGEPIKKVVVMQGNEVLAEYRTSFYDRPDVDTALKRKLPSAGFTVTVAMPIDSVTPLRLFVLSGADYRRAAELQHPLLANRASHTLVR
jgi:hypothetical protein